MMHILLKYPTRNRPSQFLATLSGWLNRIHNPSKVSVLVNCDTDDPHMTNEVIADVPRPEVSLTVVKGNNKSKVAACNADLDIYKWAWDIVLLVSDDMICCQDGWDEIVRKHMDNLYPDTDGALWFHDGYQKRFNTLECVGRRRYERFGYLYHPSYLSLFCDNENTEVGLRDGKLAFISEPICTHEHPSWGGQISFDDLYSRNYRYWGWDQKNYNKRKNAGFPIKWQPENGIGH